VLRRLVLQLIRELPATAFVETGTYLGHTAAYVGRQVPEIPIFTCEIDPRLFRRTRAHLAKFANVEVRNQSSPKFLDQLLRIGSLGSMPIFWLDAHWYSYWPLRDELSIITSAPQPSVIIIDDFQVPGEPQFGYDSTTSYEEEVDSDSFSYDCNLDYIIGSL